MVRKPLEVPLAHTVCAGEMKVPLAHIVCAGEMEVPLAHIVCAGEMEVPLAYCVRGGMTRTVVRVKKGKQMGGGKKVP